MLKLNKNGIEVGDRVVIKDVDRDVYRYYGAYLFSYNYVDLPYEGYIEDEFLSRWKYDLKPCEGDSYCVKFIGLHNTILDNTLCVVANETNTFIVDTENLQKVKVENDAVDEAEKKYLDIKTKVSELYKKAYKMDVERNNIKRNMERLAKEEELALEEFQKACLHSYRESTFSINGITGYECKRCGKKFSEKDRNYDC